MSCVEEVLRISLAGELLIGVIARPASGDSGTCGIIIPVGGPQYRVGSHRQFLLLSRMLAASGFPVLRFDYRGMGDSTGEIRSFETVTDDIGAAIEAFLTSVPSVRTVVLWGLCDAASAALLYMQERQDPRVKGLVLLNPWVRSDASLAQTQLKHYYGQRLIQRDFWQKLLCGRLNIIGSLVGLVSSAIKARRRTGPPNGAQVRPFQERMADGLAMFRGEVLLILSGKDYTAKEFLEHTGKNERWSDALSQKSVTRVDMECADHTFSSHEHRAAVEATTFAWLGRCFPDQRKRVAESRSV